MSERVDDSVIARIHVEVGSEHVICYKSVTHSTKLALVPLDLTELGGPCGDFGARLYQKVRLYWSFLICQEFIPGLSGI